MAKPGNGSSMDQPAHKPAAKPPRSIEELLGEAGVASCGPPSKPRPALDRIIQELGQAPTELGPIEERFASDLGDSLAKLKSWPRIEALARAGWATHLFPDQRWSDPFYHFAKSGPEGYAALDLLSSHGVRFFAFDRDDIARSHHSALAEAAKLGDEPAVDYFLSKLDSEGATAEQSQAALSRFVEAALTQPESAVMALRRVEADPELFAPARDKGGSVIERVMMMGHMGLATAMLDTGKAHPFSPGAVQSFTQAFRPVAAMALAIERGADAGFINAAGRSALHAAAELAVRWGRPAARLLLGAGLDARAPDKDGATPIGLALAKWSLEDLRKIFGATPEDILASQSRRSGNLPDRPSLIAAMRQAHLAPTRLKQTDERLGAILAEAAKAEGSREAAFLGQAVEAAIAQGLPECLRTVAAIAARHGVAPLVRRAMAGITEYPLNEACELGRARCMSLLPELGMGWAADDMEALMTTTLRSMRALEHRNPERACLAIRARALVEAGCDPATALDTSHRAPWWEGRDWKDATPFFREQVEGLRAIAEARELGLAVAPATPSRKPRMAL